MGEASVKVAQACGYVNAGTVEFLYQDGEFFFLEMNTRLQVEHPVTELVTGLDLVEWQLRVASGEPLGFTQDDVAAQRPRHRGPHQRRGPGRWRLHPLAGHHHPLGRPGGPGVRLDAGYESGDTVSQFYDNLVAKLVVWGHDREAARRRMLRAIDETDHRGRGHHAAGRRRHPQPPRLRRRRALDQLGRADPRPDRRHRRPHRPRRRRPPRTARSAPGAPRRDRRGRRPALPGQALGARPGRRRGRPGRRRGRRAPEPKRPKAAAAGAGSGTVAVPMQGTIVKVLVAVGDTVEVGQTVCVLEAMKMENNVNAEKAGTVKEVRVAAGRLRRPR